MTNAESTTDEVDPGVARAGAAAAARRRELDISQRSLAADGIINAGALIAFEKGRSWPRERTRARLEGVLAWPPGMISRIRRGHPIPGEQETYPPPGDNEIPLIAQAIVAAANSFNVAIDSLPPPDDPDFGARLAVMLSDLRSLEAVATRAVRISKVTPALIKALSTVRVRYDELMLRGAAAPSATLGQRLYSARRHANLSLLETAQAAGVTEEIIVRAESDEQLPPGVAQAIESLVSELD